MHKIYYFRSVEPICFYQMAPLRYKTSSIYFSENSKIWYFLLTCPLSNIHITRANKTARRNTSAGHRPHHTKPHRATVSVYLLVVYSMLLVCLKKTKHKQKIGRTMVNMSCGDIPAQWHSWGSHFVLLLRIR